MAKKSNQFDVEEKIEIARYVGKFIGFILPSGLALNFAVDIIKVKLLLRAKFNFFFE
jgi:hypothetical protein